MQWMRRVQRMNCGRVKTMLESIAFVALFIVMVGIVVNDIVYRLKVRNYIIRKRKRDLEDTLQLLGLGQRKEDQ